MIWLEALEVILAGLAAGFGGLVWRRLERTEKQPVQEAEPAPEPEDVRLRAGLANLLSYEIPRREEE